MNSAVLDIRRFLQQKFIWHQLYCQQHSTSCNSHWDESLLYSSCSSCSSRWSSRGARRDRSLQGRWRCLWWTWCHPKWSSPDPGTVDAMVLHLGRSDARHCRSDSLQHQFLSRSIGDTWYGQQGLLRPAAMLGSWWSSKRWVKRLEMTSWLPFCSCECLAVYI